MFSLLHEDAYWCILDDIRKEKQEMALTHKCDRCGEVTDEFYIVTVGRGQHWKSHELCKTCHKKVVSLLSDPDTEVVYQGPKAQLKEYKPLDSSEELSCYDKWKLTQAMQSCHSAETGRCLCDLHK